MFEAYDLADDTTVSNLDESGHIVRGGVSVPLVQDSGCPICEPEILTVERKS